MDHEEYESHLWDGRYSKKASFKVTQRRISHTIANLPPKKPWNCRSFMKHSIAPLSVVFSLSSLICLVLFLDTQESVQLMDLEHCNDSCSITLVESIPDNLTFSDDSILFPSTYDAWKLMIDEAETSVDLVVFYWTLRNSEVSPIKFASSWQGEDVFNRLLDLGANRSVKIRIVQNYPTKNSPQKESKILEENAGAQVRSINFNHLVGAGILHTKMWIVDGKHMYVGSANMDWRSLTQVKEVGLLIQNCPCLVHDVQKIFEVYWYLGNSTSIPPQWPVDFATTYNIDHPMKMNFSGYNSNVAVSSSPLSFNPDGRTNDVDAILSIINSAESFIYVAVMDYFPRYLYTKNNLFWPIIDESLRRAAFERRVHVRLLGSHWDHTRDDLPRWLKSLSALSGIHHPSINIETRLFVVPSYTDEQKKVPFGRVNHNKYMVTDKTAYIGTSNWSADYFMNTGGVGMSISPNTTSQCYGNFTEVNRLDGPIRCQLQQLFERDWNSEYAKPIAEFA